MRNTAFALAMAQSYLRWLMQWLASDRLSVITLSRPEALLAGAAGGAALTGLAGFSTTGAGAGAGAGVGAGSGAGAGAATTTGAAGESDAESSVTGAGEVEVGPWNGVPTWIEAEKAPVASEATVAATVEAAEEIKTEPSQ